MTELNCLLPADNLRLILIGNNLYQDCYVSTRFYRLAMFPRMTMFEGNMVTARECATLTTVDPYFLLLSCLVSHRHKQILQEVVPGYLRYLDLSIFCSNSETNGIYLDIQKCYDFLQKKVNRLMQHLRANGLANEGKIFLQQSQKEINQHVVNFLKAEVAEEFIIGFVEDRYKVVEMEKKVLKFNEFTQQNIERMKQKLSKQKSLEKVTKKVQKVDKNQTKLNFLSKKAPSKTQQEPKETVQAQSQQ